MTKQTKLMAAGLLLGGSVAATGSAQADTLLVQTFELDEKVASNGSFEIDLNNDGFNDFIISSSEAEESDFGSGFGRISGFEKKIVKPQAAALSLEVPHSSNPNAIGRILVDAPFVDGEVQDMQRLPTKRGLFVQRLKAGDTVDAWSGPFSSFGSLYESKIRLKQDPEEKFTFEDEDDSFEFGPFGEVGDRGFIGLSLTFGEDDLWLDDNVLQLTSIQADEDIKVMEEIDTPLVTTHYGWIEVIRGSVTAIRTGFQTVAGAAAPIPLVAVSEPAALPLVALGAAGLIALRRRKKAA